MSNFCITNMALDITRNKNNVCNTRAQRCSLQYEGKMLYIYTFIYSNMLCGDEQMHACIMTTILRQESASREKEREKEKEKDNDY